MVWPLGQLHTPPVHVDPGPHRLPHCPQLLLSVCRLVQVPLHTTSPGVAHAVHTPEMQFWPVAQR